MGFYLTKLSGMEDKSMEEVFRKLKLMRADRAWALSLVTLLLCIDVFVLGRIGQGLVMLVISLPLLHILAKDVTWSRLGLVLLFCTGLTDTFGNAFDYYGQLQSFDIYLHAFGSFALTIFAYPFAKQALQKDLMTHVVVGFLAAMFVVMLYEVGELAFENVFPMTLIRDTYDTPIDLAADIAGGVLASALVYARVIRQKTRI